MQASPFQYQRALSVQLLSRDGAGPHPAPHHAAPGPDRTPWAGWGPAPSLLLL